MAEYTKSVKRSLQERRLHTKKIMVLSMGGKCSCCGYSKCIQALEFHHINPDEKDFHFNSVVINKNNWETIVKELKKCVMLCANCHREVHSGKLSIKPQKQQFNKKYEKYENTLIKEYMDSCPVCNKPKMKYNKVCSGTCAGSFNMGKIDWNKTELKRMLKNKYTISQMADIFNVSRATIKWQLKKFGLQYDHEKS